MTEAEKLQAFLSQYRDYVSSVLQPTRAEIKGLLKSWREAGYWAKYTALSRLPAPSPIQRAFPNIKRPESVVDKILRRHSDYPEGLCSDSFRKMPDCVRARIVVYFLSHLPLIHRELQDNPLIEVSQDCPPIAYLSKDLCTRLGLGVLDRGEKVSGYSSIHYILRFRQSSVPAKDRPWWELQVRTLVEDVWGEIEHLLGYKPDKRTSFAVKKQFQVLSFELAGIDEHFNLLYEELSRFQEEVTLKDEHPLNAENLPPVLAEMGIGCAQQEVDGLLKLLVSRGLTTIGSLRAVATTRRLEVIKNSYRSMEGRTPRNFEIVANLAALRGVDNEEQAVGLIQAQIAYLRAWDELKGGFT